MTKYFRVIALSIKEGFVLYGLNTSQNNLKICLGYTAEFLFTILTFFEKTFLHFKGFLPYFFSFEMQL